MRRILIIFILATNILLHAAEPIAIVASPRYGFAPLSVRVRVSIQPHPDNRVACLVTDGPLYRSSCWPHEGVRAPITTWIDLKDLPPGEYQLAAYVERVGGKVEQTATMTICSIGEGVECGAKL